MDIKINKNIQFWDKVKKCNHRNIYDNYLNYIYCGTPYCTGYEVHCKDCGVFIIKCYCGFNNSLNGWPSKRINKHK